MKQILDKVKETRSWLSSLRMHHHHPMDPQYSGIPDDVNCDFVNDTLRGTHKKLDELLEMVNDKSKEEAIEFARKYLTDRRDDYTRVPTRITNGDLEKDVMIQEALERAWDVAVEYMLLDIIPYIFGDELD